LDYFDDTGTSVATFHMVSEVIDITGILATVVMTKHGTLVAMTMIVSKLVIAGLMVDTLIKSMCILATDTLPKLGLFWSHS